MKELSKGSKCRKGKSQGDSNLWVKSLGIW